MRAPLLALGSLGASSGAVILAVTINRIAMLRREERDTGDLWARVLVIAGVSLALLLLLAWGFQTFKPSWWDQGYHLMVDLTGVFGWAYTDRLGFWLALGAPFLLWLVLTLILLALPPASPSSARWLVGSAGFQDSRHWVLLALLPPFLLLLLLAVEDLGYGQTAYPAAIWGTLAITAVTLIAIAFSRGPRPAEPETQSAMPVQRHAPPGDWPAAMRKRGFQVETLHRLAPSPQAPPTQQVQTLLDQYSFLGKRHVATELLEALVDLLNAHQGEQNRLILGPDDCGQEELLAVAAMLVRRRLQAITLVIVPAKADILASRLARWLPPGGDVLSLQRPQLPIRTGTVLCILDSETLSDHLAELSSDEVLLNRIGLTVWWDLHAYSGVMATNFWAVSHRFHRLMKHHRRSQDLRSLTFARHHPSPDTDLAAFTTQLLPYTFRPQDRVIIQLRSPQPVELHLLEPSPELMPTEDRDVSYWDPTLTAVRTSVEAGWRTLFEAPFALDIDRSSDFLQQPLAEGRLDRHLAMDQAGADARLLEIRPGEVLSLAQLVAQGGRASEGLAVHHVGLFLPPGNPYVRHLLMRLKDDPRDFFRQARRLVPAVPQPQIIERHLLLALREMEAVASGLLQTFQWKDEIIDEILASLADSHEIKRRDVRYLDNQNHLRVEAGYESTITRFHPSPLDTVGAELIDIIEPAASDPRRMSIDPERATILAYPGRIFVHRGRTLRIDQWQNTEGLMHKRRIECTRTDSQSLTWRIHAPRLLGTRTERGKKQTFFPDLSLSKSVVTTSYQEEVTGIVEVKRNPATGAWDKPKAKDWSDPIDSRPMQTRGLFLRFLEEELQDDSSALFSIAQALHQVFTVHVGVDDDAVAILALDNERIDHRPEWGLMIVDLYPGGIGLIDAIEDDDALLIRLLELTRDWLSSCPCGTDDGCPRCLRSPAAEAAALHSYGSRLSRRDAIAVLERVFGV